MKRIAFLISGSGSDMQSVLDAIDRGEVDGKAVLAIASNAQAYGLVRAASRGIPTAVCAKAGHTCLMAWLGRGFLACWPDVKQQVFSEVGGRQVPAAGADSA